MQKLIDFYELCKDVWQNGFMGIDIGHFLVALGIFLGFLVLRKLFAHFVIKRVRRFTARTRTDLDDRLIQALERPLTFIPVVVGLFFGLKYLNPGGDLGLVSDKLLRSLVTFLLFWFLANAVEPFSFLFAKLEQIFSNSMVEWLVRAIRWMLIFLGAATVLEIWGIKVGPILAGLGLFGVAVALGAQDLFKNLISGILVLAEKWFKKGDWIKVEGVVEGTVEHIGFRSTKIRRFDKAPVHVPNAKLADSAVINFSAMTHRRIYWVIGVEYRTRVEQLRRIRDGIEAYVLENPDFAAPPDVPTFVRVDQFSDSSIDIMLYCFTKSTVWGEWLAIKEQLACAVKEIVEGAGASFAFPSQSVYLEKLPGNAGSEAFPGGSAPEPFVPPGG
jgi:MscS family membrane protein